LPLSLLDRPFLWPNRLLKRRRVASRFISWFT
jgi:hypothetical protein